MKSLAKLYRLLYIFFVLARYRIDEIAFATPWLYPFRFITFFNPWGRRLSKRLSAGTRIRLALEKLGPIFVKFGQLLSTRRDLLPDEIADELAKLQDNVPPFASAKAQQIIEDSLQHTISQLFREFEPIPLASASIAQVHSAILPDGSEVVVKVLRPNIRAIISRDISLLRTAANFLLKFPISERLHPQEMVDEFELTLFAELDLRREAANACKLRNNFLNSDKLYIPAVYWEYCRENILVLERIHGIPIANTDELTSSSIDLKKLAENGIEIFFTQVFRDNFFHADMHPGNIFVNRNRTTEPQYIAVDFGIVGTLSTEDRRYIAENLLAFFKRDYQRVAELHIESGWVPSYIRVSEFEAAIRTVCEPIFQKPLKDISFGNLLLQLFKIARHFDIDLQPQLILLQKTLWNIEGLGRQLYPELDLWHTAKPFLESWLKQQIGPKAFLKKLYSNIPYWSEKLPEIPDLIYKALQRYNEHSYLPEKAKPQQKILKRSKRLRAFLLGSSLAFLISLSITLFYHPTFTTGNWIMIGFGVTSLIWGMLA